MAGSGNQISSHYGSIPVQESMTEVRKQAIPRTNGPTDSGGKAGTERQLEKLTPMSCNRALAKVRKKACKTGLSGHCTYMWNS